MPYIGTTPGYGESNVIDSITLDGTSSTYDIMLNGEGHFVANPAELLVSINGVLQKPGTDFTISSGGRRITFTTAPASSDSIFIIHQTAKPSTIPDNSITSEKLADSLKTYSEAVITGNGSNTSFGLNFTPASSSSVLVSVNGLIKSTADYTISGNTIFISNGGSAYTSSDTIRVVDLGVKGSTRVPAEGSITQEMLSDSSFQVTTDTITTTTSANYTLSKKPINVNSILVYLDGGYLRPSDDYTLSADRTKIVLQTAPPSGLTLNVVHLAYSVKSVVAEPSANSVTHVAIQDGVLSPEKFSKRFYLRTSQTIDYAFTATAGYNTVIAGPINITGSGSINVESGAVLNII